MKDENLRNTIIFFVLAAIILGAWQFFYAIPQEKARQAEIAAHPPTAAAAQAQASALQAPKAVTREAAVAASPRVPIATPALRGSLSLRGARIDDLLLTGYRETIKKDSPPVELLRPEGAPYAWFADLGWTGANVPGLPNDQTVWTLTEGATLAPGKPVTLTYANGQGLTFTRHIAVDDKFMFTITDTVANTGAASITLAPYGSVQRQGLPEGLGKASVVHEGGMGLLDGKDRPIKYKKWEKDGSTPLYPSTGGWIGITDRYWLAALIPAQKEQMQGQYRLTKLPGVTIYDANFVGTARAIPAGKQISYTSHLFAGAKQAKTLAAYQTTYGVDRLDDAIDWGMFWFLTRPVSQILSWLYALVGNFGVAILIMTILVRGVMFPMANKQYESMTKMKKVQPAMEALRAKYKDDPTKQQQEIMALYQREKVNPIAGCLPILLTIPVFFSLFKVLQISLEMRHAPFVGWIKDLSAPDPTTIWNLFGAIPWDPSSAPLIGGLLATSLHIGVLPILYGATMWLTTSMSPPAPDPTQQQIFRLMPFLFTFIMAQFAIGLLIYYTWSNLLTAIQQYVIMRRFKVENPVDKLIARLSGKAPAAG